MNSAISHPEADIYELVGGLIKLFQDVDINGDGRMVFLIFFLNNINLLINLILVFFFIISLKNFLKI